MPSSSISNLTKAAISMGPLVRLTLMFPGQQIACQTVLDASGGNFSLAHELMVEQFGPAKLVDWKAQEVKREDKSSTDLSVTSSNIISEMEESVSAKSSLSPNCITPKITINLSDLQRSSNSPMNDLGSATEPWIIGEDDISSDKPSGGVCGREDATIKLEETNLAKRTFKILKEEGFSDNDSLSKIVDDNKDTTVSLDKTDTTKKRKSMGPDEEVPKKKTRKEPAKLDHASLWVSKKYGNCTEEGLVSIKFNNGEVHPTRFPLTAFVNIDIDQYEAIFEETDTSMQVVRPEGVTREIFDLTIQWANCGALRLHPRHRPEKQIKVLLSVVPFGKLAGIKGIEEGITAYLEIIIKKERAALVGGHIKVAFRLPSPSPIQELFINAAVIPCLHYHEVDEDGESIKLPTPPPDDEDDYPTPAHRALVQGNSFRYAWAMQNIPKFELGVLRKCIVAQHRRAIKSHNQDRVVPDPLTGKMVNLEDYMDF